MTISDLLFPARSGVQYKIEYSLPEDLYMDQWIIPAGTKVKLVSSIYFGYVILPVKCLDKRGFQVPKRIFKY